MSAWLYFLVFPLTILAGGLLILGAPEVKDAWGNSKTNPIIWILALGIMLIGLVVGLSQGCGYKAALNNSKEIRSFTVNKVERGTDDKPDLVYTNVGVFSVQDSFWLWKFDTSDRYGKIVAGNTYTCEVAGWRIRFLSEWENLISCKEKA